MTFDTTKARQQAQFSRAGDLNSLGDLLLSMIGAMDGDNALPGRKIALLGDSLCQQSNAATVDDKVSNWSKGFMTWAQTLGPAFVYNNWYDANDLNGRYWTGANHGVSGNMVAQVFARVGALIAMRPDWCVNVYGTNDIGTKSVSYINAYTEDICRAQLDSGIRVILFPVYARATASWASASAERKKALAVNQYRREFCRKTPGMYWFDANKYIVDPASTDGAPLANYMTDGIHPDPLCGYQIGKGFAAFLTGLGFPPRQPSIVSYEDLYDATYNVYGSLTTNPLMQGTGGTASTGASGTIPANCQIARNAGSAVTVVSSIEARTDGGAGNWWVLTFSLSGSSIETFYARTPASSANTTHGLAAGTWVKAFVDVNVAAYSGWKEIRLLLSDQGTNGLDAYGHDSYNSSGLKLQPTEAWAGTIETPAIQIVSGSTTIRYRVEVTVDAAIAGTPVIKLGCLCFRPVPDPRLAWNAA